MSVLGDASGKPQRPRSAPRAGRWVSRGHDLAGRWAQVPASSVPLLDTIECRCVFVLRWLWEACRHGSKFLIAQSWCSAAGTRGVWPCCVGGLLRKAVTAEPQRQRICWCNHALGTRTVFGKIPSSDSLLSLFPAARRRRWPRRSHCPRASLGHHWSLPSTMRTSRVEGACTAGGAGGHIGWGFGWNGGHGGSARGQAQSGGSVDMGQLAVDYGDHAPDCALLPRLQQPGLHI